MTARQQQHDSTDGWGTTDGRDGRMAQKAWQYAQTRQELGSFFSLSKYIKQYMHHPSMWLQKKLILGFISITRYRDIDRGIGDLVIIAAPRDQTISRMKASLTQAQQLTLNSRDDTYRKDIHWMTDGQSATEHHHLTTLSSTHNNIT